MRTALILTLLLGIAAVAGAQVTITSITPTSGPTSGGTLVTITGTNFDDTVCPILCTGPTVIIGGVFVPATIVNPTTATFITPPHTAGLVDVTIRPVFASATLPNAFRYDETPAVPTLSTWTIAALAVLLAAAGLFAVRRL